jgi:hypothetical protein
MSTNNAKKGHTLGSGHTPIPAGSEGVREKRRTRGGRRGIQIECCCWTTAQWHGRNRAEINERATTYRWIWTGLLPTSLEQRECGRGREWGGGGRKQDTLESEHTPFPTGPEIICEKSHPREEDAEGFKSSVVAEQWREDMVGIEQKQMSECRLTGKSGGASRRRHWSRGDAADGEYGGGGEQASP